MDAQHRHVSNTLRAIHRTLGSQVLFTLALLCFVDSMFSMCLVSFIPELMVDKVLALMPFSDFSRILFCAAKLRCTTWRRTHRLSPHIYTHILACSSSCVCVHQYPFSVALVFSLYSASVLAGSHFCRIIGCDTPSDFLRMTMMMMIPHTCQCLLVSTQGSVLGLIRAACLWGLRQNTGRRFMVLCGICGLWFAAATSIYAFKKDRYGAHQSHHPNDPISAADGVLRNELGVDM